MENIVDSGERRQFSTGAQRDMACKGRCDLLPWDVMAEHFNEYSNCYRFCMNMHDATHHIDLQQAIANMLDEYACIAFTSYEAAMLESAFHFEAGAKKYSDRNWENGWPVDVSLDSAGRHFLKYLRGDDDERHDRAVVTNLLMALFTIKHHPELIDVPFGGDK